MAGPRVGGGSPQDTLKTMNQSMGQLMTFIQNQKQLNEMQREFNIEKGLATFEKMAIQAGGYRPLADLMGDSLPEYFTSIGMDSDMAGKFSNVMSKIKLTPQQFTMETIKDTLLLPPDDPRYQRLFISGEFGGEMGAPDPRTGVAEVAGEALDVAGGLLEGFGPQGQAGIDTGETSETDDPEAAARAKAAAEKAEADRLAAIKEKERLEIEAEIAPLQRAYTTAVEKGFTKEAEELKEQIGDLGGTVGKVVKPDLRSGLVKDIEGKVVPAANISGYQVYKDVSGTENRYISKFEKTLLPGIFPTGFQGGKVPDALAGGIPTTQAEFNKIQSPTRRDRANLNLVQAFKTGAIPDEDRNHIVNLMDGTYTPSPLEGATLMKNFREKSLIYDAQVKAGEVPPLPAWLRRSRAASEAVANAYVNDIPMDQISRQTRQEAAKEMVRNALTPEVRDELADRIDLIINVSKNPAMATYFMPTVEANRLENKKLAQADMRLLANKDITATNQLLGVLGFLRSMMSSSAEGNEALLLSLKGGEKAYMQVLNTTKSGSAERAQAFLDAPLAASYQQIAGTLLNEAAGRPVGTSVKDYAGIWATWANMIFGSSLGQVETFEYQPIPPIQEPRVGQEPPAKSIYDLNL